MAEAWAEVETSEKEKNSTREGQRFCEFWALYWRKVSRSDAAKAYRKHVFSEEIHGLVLTAVQIQSPSELAKEPQFRPHAATWLNQRRWEDEADPVPIPVNGQVKETALERLIREA